jgi:hypothetical protein
LIIVDYSQVLLASVFVFADDFKKGADPEKMKGILRHTLLSSLLVYKREYGKKYGEIVIACDGREYWRKKYFPAYKASRKKGREESELDWNAIFTHLADMRQELIDYFPWKVILIPAAEGDDIMSVLTDYCLENNTTQDGLFEDVEPVLLISSDGDMKQKQGKHVRQWSPMQKKFVAPPEKDFLIDKIIRGDQGDAVPSVLCPDDWFTNPEFDGVRAKPVTKKVLERFKAGVGLSKEESDRYIRNKTLVDLSCIPEDVKADIISAYENAKPVKDLNGVMNFLMSVRAKQLLERVQEFKV